MSGDDPIRPVIVFSISGATWRIIEPMVARGQLPNISLLRTEGSSGVLHSIRAIGDKHFRPQVAWPTLASGLRPEKHGITRFYHDARDARAPMLWDTCQRNGLKVGLFGWPITWPPKPLEGFVIPSHLARDTQTWPPELRFIKALDRQEQNAERAGGGRQAICKLELAQSLRAYGVGWRTMARLGVAFARLIATRNSEKRAIVLRHMKLDLSLDLFLCLETRYQTGFSAFTTFLVDLVSHRYWRLLVTPQLREEDVAQSRVRPKS
jgi:hypothetical protein